MLWREIVVPGDGTGWVNAGYLTETAPALLDDGRHAAYLHEVDVDGRTITVDVIQFLTGQALTSRPARHASSGVTILCSAAPSPRTARLRSSRRTRSRRPAE